MANNSQGQSQKAQVKRRGNDAGSASDQTSLRDLIRQEIQLLQQQAQNANQVTDTNTGGTGQTGGNHTSGLTQQQLQEMIRQALTSNGQNPNDGQSQSQANGGASSGSASNGGLTRQQLQQMIRQEIQKSSGSSADGASGGGGNSTSGSSLPRKVRQILQRGQTGGQNQAQGQNQSQSQNQNQSQASSQNTGSLAVNPTSAETVAQVLTQAQYELSQELEANLKKLRSVIQQSQEIAKKIELVLGQGEKGSGNSQ